MRIAEAADQDRFREIIGSFWFAFPDVPDVDPRDEVYRSFWMRTYERLAGKAYVVSNERTATTGGGVFPYSTGDANLVGTQLIAIGSVIRAMKLARGAKVLELGAGWGNSSIALARMGYEVTVIDIGADYLELIDRQAKANGVRISLIEGDFFSIADQPRESLIK